MSLHARALDFLPADQASEVFEGTVVGSLRVLREAAPRQLSALQVIVKTLAADALPRTTAVSAIAPLQVSILLAVHGFTSQCDEAALLPPLMITVPIRTIRITSQAMTAFHESKIE